MPGLVAILGAISLVLLCGCSAVSADRNPVEQADDRYREGRFVEAERLYREALSAEPDNARVWEMLGTLSLWRNDLTGAESHFKTAERHQSWLSRRWPMNIQTNVHRALVHARAGRLSEAAELLDQAAGFLPFGPFKELKIRSRQLALFGDQASYRVEGPDETEMPFIVTDPLPVVRVSVNGAPTVEFAIDTGGESLVLDCAYAREVGAAIVGTVEQEYAGGKKGLTGYGKADTVMLGEMTVRNVPVSCVDLKSIADSVFAGRAIKGMIGTGLLMQFLATLDYPGQRLLLRQYSNRNVTTDTAAGAAERVHSFPMWLVETHLIFAQGSLNDLEPGLMFIDTGLADAGFHTSQDIFTAAGVAMDWSQAEMGAGGGGMTKALRVTVSRVALGSGDNAMRKHNLRGIAFENDLALFNGAVGFKVGGLISHQFFRDHAVTFDFRNMRLIVGR